jgi:hypothetical protein
LATASLALSIVFYLPGAGSAQSSGQSNPLASLEAELNYRQAHLARRLKDAVDAKRIEVEQAKQFSNLLSDIENEEVKLRDADDQLNLYELESLLFRQDDLMKSLEASLKPREAGALDVVKRYQELKRRLTSAFKAGRLSESEFNQLNVKLQDIYSLEKTGANLADLTVAELLAIQLKLDSFSKLLTRQVKDRQVPRETYDFVRANLENRINNLLKSKVLNKSQAGKLLKKLAQAQKTQESILLQARYLTYQQQLQLAKPYYDLEAQLDLIAPISPTILTISLLAGKIDQTKQELIQALMLGTVSPQEAQKHLGFLQATYDKLIKDCPTEQVVTKEESAALEHLLTNLRQVNAQNNISWPGYLEKARDLNARLGQAKETNRLSQDKFEDLYNEFQSIQNSQKLTSFQFLRENKVTPQQVLEAIKALDKLETTLELALSTRSEEKIPEADIKLQQLDKQISASLLEGKLTPSAARALMQELSNLWALKAKLLSNATLSQENKAYALAVQEEKLTSQLNLSLKTSRKKDTGLSESLKSKTKELENFISQGTISGALRPSEIQEARERIAKALALLSSSEGVNATTAYTAAQELENVKETLVQTQEDEVSALPNLAQKQAQVYKHISEAVLTGMLAPERADSIKRAYYKLLDRESSYRNSGGLSFGETATLVIELEKLEAKIAQEELIDPTSAKSLDAIQKELEEAITQALLLGKLNVAEAEQIGKELDKISRDKISMQFQPSTTASAMKTVLTNKIKALQDQFEAATKNKAAGWNSLEERLKKISVLLEEASSKLDAEFKKQALDSLRELSKQQAIYEETLGLSLAEAASILRDCQRLQENIERQASNTLDEDEHQAKPKVKKSFFQKIMGR